MKGRGQARPEPPGRDDKRQQWRHFKDTISTCPSAAASGSTQPRGGRQRAALCWRDKEGRDTLCSQILDIQYYDVNKSGLGQSLTASGFAAEVETRITMFARTLICSLG